jgi:hypothetical protein
MVERTRPGFNCGERSRLGLPQSIIVDNGPEFAGRALDAWAYARGVTLRFIRPDKPGTLHPVSTTRLRRKWQQRGATYPRTVGRRRRLRASFLVRPSIVERFAIVSGRGADAINRPVTMPE